MSEKYITFLMGLPVLIAPTLAHAQTVDSISARDAFDQEEAAQRRIEQQEQVPSQQVDETIFDINVDHASGTSPQTGFSTRVGSVLVETDESIDQSIFAIAIEPFLGQTVTQEDLARLAQEIAQIARDNGMVLANAFIPTQSIELGIVRIVLDIGRIDSVRIEGSDNQAVARILAPLAGRQGDHSDLERRILLANDIPGIRVLSTRILNEGGQRIFVVRVRDKANRHHASIDNFGTNSFGPLRARLSFNLSGLLDDSDLARISVRTNPSDPEEIVSAFARYEIGIGNNGTRLGLAGSFSESEPGGALTGSGFESSSRYAAISARHPLIRSLEGSLWATAEASYLKVDQEVLDALIRSDTIVTFSIGLSSSVKVANGWLQSGAEFTQGVDLFGASRFGDPLNSRFDGDGVFSAGNFWTSWTGPIHDDLSIRIAASGQIASRPLLSAQELGIGGIYSVRGFDFSERSGDQGVIGLVELRYDWKKLTKWLDQLQLYGFVDGGYVDNLRGGFGDGTLLSAGGGVRGDIGPLDFRLEAAAPLNTDREESADQSPKINFEVGVSF